MTVVSDATQEFPQNQNNHFKVRLPRPLTLLGGPWGMSLWSLSVPDGAVETKLGQGTDTVCITNEVVSRLSNVQGGKYTAIEGNTSWIVHTVTLADTMVTKPKTGVEFWTRALQRLDELRRNTLQTEAEKDVTKRVQATLQWNPTFRWKGEVMILQANKGATYDDRARGTPFFIPYKIAQAFGFAKQDPVTQKWSLGPNAIACYPVYDQMPLPMADFTMKPQGPTVFVPDKGNLPSHRTRTWAKNVFNATHMGFSTGFEWHFIHLDRSFARLTNQLETVMVYTDAVQANTVNHRQVPLLRSLHLHRSGRGRVTVEPLHREWIPLNGPTLELMEVQLATASGPLTDLSPGQTIVTLGLKPIKR